MEDGHFGGVDNLLNSVFFQMSVMDNDASPPYDIDASSQAVKRRRYRNRYPCNVCGYLSRGNYYLRRHMRSHTGERPYTCSLCGKSYTRKEHLSSHVSASHEKKTQENLK